MKLQPPYMSYVVDLFKDGVTKHSLANLFPSAVFTPEAVGQMGVCIGALFMINHSISGPLAEKLAQTLFYSLRRGTEDDRVDIPGIRKEDCPTKTKMFIVADSKPLSFGFMQMTCDPTYFGDKHHRMLEPCFGRSYPEEKYVLNYNGGINFDYSLQSVTNSRGWSANT